MTIYIRYILYKWLTFLKNIIFKTIIILYYGKLRNFSLNPLSAGKFTVFGGY